MNSFPPPHHPCSLKTLHRDLSLAILLTGRGEEEQNTRGDICPQSLSTHFVSCSLHVYMLCVHTCILLHLALRGLDTLEKTEGIVGTVPAMALVHIVSSFQVAPPFSSCALAMPTACLLGGNTTDRFGSGPSLHSSKQTSFLLHKQL